MKEIKRGTVAAHSYGTETPQTVVGTANRTLSFRVYDLAHARSSFRDMSLWQPEGIVSDFHDPEEHLAPLHLKGRLDAVSFWDKL